MNITIHTDKHIQGGASLAEHMEADLASALDRFAHRLTRVEVHLSNESAGRTTGQDFRCLIEARPAGMDAVVVTHHGASHPEAFRAATDSLEAALTSKYERLEGHESRDTIRHQ
ncbi:HPF/RaiA family ribosome-associated protein [Nocardioides sp.]|uniref:HPF/RaiA family ribosome-associated protein n=1 Tax=Nocardioides sp. TaxID=35761 RepID=UPI003564E996